MVEHTPGPWWLGKNIGVVFGSDGHAIQTAGENVGSEGYANARLIAAAPDLLAAAQRINGRRERDQAIELGDLDRLRAAIEKAEGKIE